MSRAGSLAFRKVPMAELIKEERYIFSIGTEEHVLRVQELVSGSTPWPEPFRTHLPASNFREARKFHGRTALAAADRATEYISSTVREVPPYRAALTRATKSCRIDVTGKSRLVIKRLHGYF